MKKKSNECLREIFFSQELSGDSTDSDWEEPAANSNSDGTDGSANSNSDGSDSDDENSSDEDNDDSDSELNFLKNTKDTKPTETNPSTDNNVTLENLLHQAKSNDQEFISKQAAKCLTKLVCCACLGDRSDYDNEIVECDGCGITVHECCYGVSDSASISSTVSSCSTEPWFCEACKANVKDPDCELCPNRGGIFKETDVGKWVHLVCALYVPGVAFGEVDLLSSVTLFEMPYSKWGAKTCSLCDDERFARTGVCIGCDAGMCKTYFHVTCAQKAGLLSEPHHDEVEHADPFYAHCKLHSDKTLIKHRQRNYNALLLRVKRREMDEELRKNEKPTPEQERIERKLKKHRLKYSNNKQVKPEPWVPTQKMSRLLNTSASACKKLMRKRELMGIDATALEFQEAQIASLTDIRKKWHIPPAFSVEFIGYYLDRTIRLKEMKENLQKQVQTNAELLVEQKKLGDQYEELLKLNQEAQERNTKLLNDIEKMHSCILTVNPGKQLMNPLEIGKPVIVVPAPTPAPAQNPPNPVTNSVKQPTLSSTPPPQLITSRTMTVPTAAALKMGVGFPLNNLIPGRKDDGKILSTQCPNNEELLNECGICKRSTDQHLLAKCDTCHLFYHLGCLNPPLTRHPKKSKLYGWQCSECDKSDDSDPERVIIPKAPRRSRIRYSKDGSIIQTPSDDKYDSSLNRSNVSTDIEGELINNSTKINNIGKRKKGRTSNASLTSGNESDMKNGHETQMIDPPAVMPDVKIVIEKVEEKVLLAASPVAAERKEKEMVEQPKANKKIKKVKRSLSQISQELQDHYQKQLDNNKVEELKVEPDVSIVEEEDRPTKIPKLNNMDSVQPLIVTPDIPPVSVEVVPEIVKTEVNGTVTMNAAVNGEVINDFMSTSSGHHKHKKRKDKDKDKEKHHKSSKHSHSPTSMDRTITKEHKRKRKRKNHDVENPNQSQMLPKVMGDVDRPHPPIKLKFKTIHLPAGSKKTTQLYCLPADSEPVAESSGQFMSELTTVKEEEPMTTIENGLPLEIDTQKLFLKKTVTPSPRRRRPSVLLSPSNRKSISTSTPIPSTSKTPIMMENLVCDVCQAGGTVQNLVKCDECLKNYHFQCLNPPLTRNPKKRGYGWICSECDPTDNENK